MQRGARGERLGSDTAVADLFSAVDIAAAGTELAVTANIIFIADRFSAHGGVDFVIHIIIIRAAIL